MKLQADLFSVNEEAVYAVDTSSFLNILKLTDDEPYAMDVMEGVLEFIQTKLASGKIICPIAIYDELKKREDKVKGLKDWLKKYRDSFYDLDQKQITEMKPIVDSYPIYGTDKGDYGDLALIAFAKSRGLIVVSSEKKHKDQHRKNHPKVPNICEEYDVKCTSLIGLLRAEGVKLTLSSE